MASLDLIQIESDLKTGSPIRFKGLRLGEKQWASLLPLVKAYPKTLIPVLPSLGAAHLMEAYTKSLRRDQGTGHRHLTWPSLPVWRGLLDRLEATDPRLTVLYSLLEAAQRWMTCPVPLEKRSSYQSLLSMLLEKINWDHPVACPNRERKYEGKAWRLMREAMNAYTLPQVLAPMLVHLDGAVNQYATPFMKFVPEWHPDAPPLHGLADEPVVWEWLMAITPPQIYGQVAAEVCLVGRKDEEALLMKAGAMDWHWPMKKVWADAVSHDKLCRTQKKEKLEAAILKAVDDPERSADFRKKVFESCRVIGQHVLLERYRLDDLSRRPASKATRPRSRV